jgi:hypothetical protein
LLDGLEVCTIALFLTTHLYVLAQLENGRYEDGFLLGDSGYACRSFILTPLLNPRTPAEEAYNNSHRAQEIQLKGVLACSSDDFRALLLAYALKWTQLLQLL